MKSNQYEKAAKWQIWKQLVFYMFACLTGFSFFSLHADFQMSFHRLLQNSANTLTAKSQVKISASVYNSCFQNKVVPFVLMHLGRVNFFTSLVGGRGGTTSEKVQMLLRLSYFWTQTREKTEGENLRWRGRLYRCWRGAVAAGCAGRGKRNLWLGLGRSTDLWRRQSSFLLLSAFVWFVPFILSKTIREKQPTES